MKKILIASLVALAAIYGLAWLYGHIAEPVPSVFNSVKEYQIPAPQNTNIQKDNVSLKSDNKKLTFESAHKRTE